MAVPLVLKFLILALQVFASSFLRVAHAADAFVSSRAVYYPNSESSGTDVGACGFGKFGASLNGGDVSASAQLYRNGVGCGACYQVKCTNTDYCSDQGVTVVVTDFGASDGADFILSQHAFSRMAVNQTSASSLLQLGVVNVQYTRVSCRYPNTNMRFKIDESSNFPHYLALLIWNQQGTKDVIAVQLCETTKFRCKLVDRSHGAVWTVVEPPTGPLLVRMLVSGGQDGDETWLVPTNVIPQDWKAGDVYDSGVQLQA
ncbi:Expansin-like B1 [Nymphaea thermarum]|nr:Expansin-like B1 [Nymphaea thermarum]